MNNFRVNTIFQILTVVLVISLSTGCSSVNSLSDYTFIGAGYGYLTTPSTPLNADGSYNGKQIPYVPDLTNLTVLDIVYVSPNGKGNGKSEEDPTTLQKALLKGVHNRVIIALDGEYDIENLMLEDINNVHLIAKNKGKATITYSNGNANFELGNSNVSVHDFSIIGFKAIGNGNGRDNFFIFGPGNGLNYNAYNIYLSNMEWSAYSCVIYGGLHSHDWTIDKSLFYNSTYEYIWYMMGWHHTIMNTVMYNDSYLAAVIRGSYPPDEEYIYHGKNRLIADRTTHFLADNDWTHIIVNNTFGSCHFFVEDHKNTIHTGLWYDLPNDEHGRTEDCYFPPKNIIIANNAFIDNGKLNKKPILFAASRGINDTNTTNVASVNGVIISHNYADNSELIEVYGSTDMSSIDLTSNVLNFNNFGFDDDNRDYTITIQSGLVNKGDTSVYFPNVDNSGQLRNGVPDVGAYEALD